ncbi:MAG: hypothetical protein XE08_0304, partial [Parcubacteria bacterium 32_520]|jgi:hypothetical protein
MNEKNNRHNINVSDKYIKRIAAAIMEKLKTINRFNFVDITYLQTLNI